jgi:hypothetical protein
MYPTQGKRAAFFPRYDEEHVFAGHGEPSVEFSNFEFRFSNFESRPLQGAFETGQSALDGAGGDGE